MATSFSFYITAVYEEDSKYSLFLLDVLLVYQFPIMLPKRRFGRDKMSNSIENYLVMVDSDAICKCVIVYFYWLAGLCVMSKWVWYKYEKETQSDSDVEIKLFIYLAPLLIPRSVDLSIEWSFSFVFSFRSMSCAVSFVKSMDRCFYLNIHNTELKGHYIHRHVFLLQIFVTEIVQRTNLTRFYIARSWNPQSKCKHEEFYWWVKIYWIALNGIPFFIHSTLFWYPNNIILK